MGGITNKAADVYRDFLVAGVPASGPNDPDKASIRGLFTAIDQNLAASVAGIVYYATGAERAADTARPVGTLAKASNEPDYYRRTADGWVVDNTVYEGVATVLQPYIDQTNQATADIATIYDGSVPAQLVEDTANSEHRIYRNHTFFTGRTYEFEAVVKANGRPQINLTANEPGLGINGIFDLNAKAVTGTGATIMDRGDGEFLLKVTRVATAPGSVNAQIRMLKDGDAPYIGDGMSGLFILSATWKENGVVMGGTDAASILSSEWVKQGVTAQLSTTYRFTALAEKVYAAAAGNDASKPFAGKKWAALGTSQTIGGNYTSRIVQNTGMILTNLAVSGATFSNGGDNMSAGIYNQISNIPPDTEFISGEGVINDHYFNVPLGTIGDTTLGTFYGALYAWWRAAALRAPNARISLIMGHAGAGSGPNAAGRNARSANAIGLYVRDYQEAMFRFCTNDNVLLSAAGRSCGINETNGDRVLIDGLHDNILGGAIFGDCVTDDFDAFARRGMFI